MIGIVRMLNAYIGRYKLFPVDAGICMRISKSILPTRDGRAGPWNPRARIAGRQRCAGAPPSGLLKLANTFGTATPALRRFRTMTTIVEQLSSYAAALRFEDLPGEVIHQAKRLIIDTIGCALGGYASEPAKIAREIAGTVASGRPAT